MVEQWNNHDGTVEHLMVEQWNILWLNSGTSDGGTVKQSCWNSKISDGWTVEHLMVEQ